MRNESHERARATHDGLLGGGEMGALMRSLDWSSTPLGAVSGWPQSLRTALSILLESRFPMYIAWGPRYIQFYNDGYRPILGSTKHPAAMGISAAETFAESWHIIGPMFEGVRQGTPVGSEDWMLPLDRHGFLEECYFTFSYSPIRDESGDVGGVLVTVTETTDRVLGERRLKTLRDLSSQTALAKRADEACITAGEVLAGNAADLPIALLYLVDRDRRHAHLVAAAGIARGTAASPDVIDLASDDGPWPIAATARGGAAIFVEALPLLPSGTTPPRRALVLPVALPGEELPTGVLVVALSPRLVFDGKYRSFLELVARQLASAIASTRALEEARARAEALAEIDRAKTTFFSNVSHELRTPLTLLLGPSEDALAAPDALTDEERARWQLVRRNALRLLKLVNTLLDFSRIEAGRMQAAFEPTNLAQLTRNLGSVFQSAIERAGLTLRLDLPDVGEPVYVDRSMWEKIVLNLLSNALKFTFEGAIELGLQRREGRVTLTVRDSGVGVAAEELPRLFDRFHRAPASRARTHEGTGIGLALVQELVKLHGGSVAVESALGRGTTFTVEIPLGATHLPADRIGAPRTNVDEEALAVPFLEEAQRWSPAAAPRSESRAAGRPARILLADDNADMRDYLAGLLGERWTVETAADGAAALAQATASPPDLVLADIMMPGLDGIALLRALRAGEATRAIPVIFLSARAGEEASIEGLGAGADDYLVKPFSARELVARVSTHLELSRLRAEADLARARLYQHFQQAPVAISVVVGEELRFELANPLYERMVGRTGVAGRTMREVFPELAVDAPVLLILREVMATGEPFVAEEYRVPLDVKGDGALEDRFFKFTSSPIRDGAGAVAALMTVAVDVTPQVLSRRAVERAQRALAEQSRVTETLNRIGMVLHAELDLEKVLQTLTDEATALCRAQMGAFFYNVTGEQGERYTLHVLSGVRREVFDRFPLPRNTRVFGPTFRGEGVVRSGDITRDPRYGQNPPFRGLPDGHPPVRSYLAVPVPNRAGAVTGGLFFGHPTADVFTESDERMMVAVAAQAATAIEKARLFRQVQFAEARMGRLQAITATLSHAITPRDAGQTILREVMPVLGAAGGCVMLLDADRSALEVFVSEGDTDAVALDQVSRVPIDAALPVCDAARRGVVVWLPTVERILERNPELAAVQERQGVKSWGAFPLQFEGQTVGVASFHCTHERTLSPLEEEFLLAAGAQCAQAIERARLYEDARRSRAEAEAANQAKDEFLAMLGHELRNPLAPIQTALQLMRLRGDDTLTRERTVIERQVGHVVRLVDDLLDVSRITRGKVELRREPVEIAEVVAKAIEMASPLIEERHHALSVTVPRSGLSVDGDQVRLAQVVSNLLTNAAKYTPANGSITVAAERSGAQVVLRVIDTGIGLDGAMLPRVFELFVQEPQAIDRAQGGLGLGLAIVRSLVELHGGTVEAHSEGRDRGSQFVVRLPWADRPAAGVERSGGPDRLPARAPLEDATRILVVDDNTDAADLLAESLRAMGYRTAIAYDGPTALRLAADFRPLVALLDIGLPVMDGYELAHQLKRDGAHRELRLVAITGYGQESDRARSERAGFDRHLVKPIHLDEVSKLLGELARRR